MKEYLSFFAHMYRTFPYLYLTHRAVVLFYYKRFKYLCLKTYLLSISVAHNINYYKRACQNISRPCSQNNTVVFFYKTTPAKCYLKHISVCAWCNKIMTYWQFSSVAQLCPTICDPTNHSTPGFPVHHQLLEFTQTHVHWVGDAIQPSHPLLSSSPPALNLSQHQGLFKWVFSWHQMAKVLEFQL